MSQVHRKGSLLNFSVSDVEEDKVIGEVLTTPFEKVIRILNKTKQKLIDISYDSSINTLVQELAWAIQRIQSHNLYTYEIDDNSIEISKLSKNSHEVQSFLKYINNFSETKDFKRRNKAAAISRTVKINSKTILPKYNALKRERSIDLGKGLNITESNEELNNNSEFNNIDSKNNQEKISNIRNLKLNGSQEESFQGSLSPIRIHSPINKYTPINIKSDNIITISENSINVIEAEEEDSNEDALSIFMNNINEKDFNVFTFADSIGREKALILGSKKIIENLSISNLVDSEQLESFLKAIKLKYNNNPYHSDLHGLDICQTVNSYFRNSDIEKILHLTEMDIFSIIVASLVHDLGHPGLTNNYQINSFSDLAVTYNDKSILENYHISETFKIIKNEDSNIFSNFNNENFKLIRKRIIESIFATDMIYHAKINSTIKNLIETKEISKGNKIDTLIDVTSKTLFDDQQNVINFIVHTADLSHNSKEFEISKKWTYLLMDEFWNQGDTEKKLNLPISMFCDRTTADVPKSQIGFIKGIIIPSFDIMIDLFPSLIYLKLQVEINLRGWIELIEKEEENKKINK